MPPLLADFDAAPLALTLRVATVATGAALLLGLVLGYMVESNYRRSLLISGGDHSIFVTDLVSAGLLALAVMLTGYTGIKEFTDRKSKA